MSSTEATFDPRHPHEPEIPPTLDAEGRCLVCGLSVRLQAAESERDRLQEKANRYQEVMLDVAAQLRSGEPFEAHLLANRLAGATGHR